MWKCKLWTHKWIYKEESRTCERCGLSQKWLGYKIGLNRDEVRTVANNRYLKRVFMPRIPWAFAWLVTFFLYAAFGPNAWWSALILGLYIICPTIVIVGLLSRGSSKEFEKLEKEIRQ